jgi:hypothetical protein
MRTLRAASHAHPIPGLSFVASPASLARVRDVTRISHMSSLLRNMDIGSASAREAHRITKMSLLSSSAYAKLMGQHASVYLPKALPKFPEPPVYRSSPRLEVVPLRNPWADACPVCEHNKHVAEESDREPDGYIGYRLGRFRQCE